MQAAHATAGVLTCHSAANTREGVGVDLKSTNSTDSRSGCTCQVKLLRADPAASVGDKSTPHTAAGIANAQKVLLRGKAGRLPHAGPDAVLV